MKCYRSTVCNDKLMYLLLWDFHCKFASLLSELWWTNVLLYGVLPAWQCTTFSFNCNDKLLCREVANLHVFAFVMKARSFPDSFCKRWLHVHVCTYVVNRAIISSAFVKPLNSLLVHGLWPWLRFLTLWFSSE